MYKELFRGHIWTACDVDELKPSGWGVKAARQEACGPDAAASDGVWVHVGDQPSADGGAATASGSLFVQCDAGVGIDFSVIRWLLASTTLEEANKFALRRIPSEQEKRGEQSPKAHFILQTVDELLKETSYENRYQSNLSFALFNVNEKQQTQ